MHRPSSSRFAMIATSIAAMMKGAGDSMMKMQQAASEAQMSVADLQVEMEKMGFKRYPHPKSHAAFLHQESKRPSPSYLERQKVRRRYDNGLPVPDDVRAAYERHAAERADIARRRAFYDQHPSVRARFAGA